MPAHGASFNPNAGVPAPATRERGRTPAIELCAKGLSKSFATKIVLDDISVTIRAGEIVCIVGGSGSGKTVLLDHLVGLIAPTKGRVLVADHHAPATNAGDPPLRVLGELSDEALDLLRLHWSVVFQRNALFSGSVSDNITLWLREHTTLLPADIDRRVRAGLKAVGLDVADVLLKDSAQLSGGMAKRVAIARAIVTEPLVVFYDEPTAGLDPMAASTIQELIWTTHLAPLGSTGEYLAHRDLSPEQSAALTSQRLAGLASTRTTIVVTHDRDLLRRLRPRVIMLHERKVCFDGPYVGFGKSDCPPAEAYLRQMPELHSRDRTGGLASSGG